MQNYSGMPYIPYMPPCMMMPMPPQMSQPTQTSDDKEYPEKYIGPESLADALRVLRRAVSQETRTKMFCKYMVEAAPTEEEKQLMQGILEDENRHFKLLRQIHFELTGQLLPPPFPPQEAGFEKPASYCEGLKRGLLTDQANNKRCCRRILYALCDRKLINMSISQIMDEMRHTVIYNYLYSKNNCQV